MQSNNKALNFDDLSTFGLGIFVIIFCKTLSIPIPNFAEIYFYFNLLENRFKYPCYVIEILLGSRGKEFKTKIVGIIIIDRVKWQIE